MIAPTIEPKKINRAAYMSSPHRGDSGRPRLHLRRTATVAWCFLLHCARHRNNINSFKLIDGSVYAKDQIHGACPTGAFVFDGSEASFIPYSSILLVTSNPGGK
jgi:hypothetical protein